VLVLLNTTQEILTRAIWQDKENEGIQIGKKEVKLFVKAF
jgi:hypothetical protein